MMYILTQEEYDALKDKNISEQIEAETNKRLRKFGKRLDELVKEARLKTSHEMLQMASCIKTAMVDANVPEVFIIKAHTNSRGEII